MIEVLDRGKFQFRHHHFISWPPKIEARGNHSLRLRYILMQGNLAPHRANQWSDLVAHADCHFPPAFFPGTNASLSPRIRIRLQTPIHTTRHRPQRIADQIGRAVENWKLAPPRKQIIHFSSFQRWICGFDRRAR